MNRLDISIEDLLPHRGRMKLVDEIVELDPEQAVTAATVPISGLSSTAGRFAPLF